MLYVSYSRNCGCNECRLIVNRRNCEKNLRELQQLALVPPSKPEAVGERGIEFSRALATAAQLTANAAALAVNSHYLKTSANNASGSGSKAERSAGGAKLKRERNRANKSGGENGTSGHNGVKSEKQAPPNWSPRSATGGAGTNHSVSHLIGGCPTPALGLGIGRGPMPNLSATGGELGLGVGTDCRRGMGVPGGAASSTFFGGGDLAADSTSSLGFGVGMGHLVGDGRSACLGSSTNGSSFPFTGWKQASPLAFDYSPSLDFLAGRQPRADCSSGVGGSGALSSTSLFGLSSLAPSFPFTAQPPSWSSVVNGARLIIMYIVCTVLLYCTVHCQFFFQ